MNHLIYWNWGTFSMYNTRPVPIIIIIILNYGNYIWVIFSFVFLCFRKDFSVSDKMLNFQAAEAKSL